MTAKTTSTGVIDWGALTFFLDICECLESCDLLDSCDSVVDSSDSMHGGEGCDRLDSCDQLGFSASVCDIYSMYGLFCKL